MTTAEMKSKLLEIAVKKGRVVETVAAMALDKSKSTKAKKLPVPGPKPAQVAASAAKPIADPKKDGIPVGLQTQNRTTPTAEQQARIDDAAAKAKSASGDQHQQELRAMQKANKSTRAKIKSTARKERKAAEKSGATKAWPVTGKAAAAVLATPGKPKGKPQGSKKAAGGTSTTPKAKKPVPARPRANGGGSVVLRPDGLRAGSGMAILADTVCRKGGATNEELCKAVGWAQCLPMMKKACERAKIKLRVEKKSGEPTRYFGTAK